MNFQGVFNRKLASVGIEGILGMKISPLAHSDRIVALVRSGIIFLTTSLFPLESFGGKIIYTLFNINFGI